MRKLILSKEVNHFVLSVVTLYKKLFSGLADCVGHYGLGKNKFT